MFLISSFTSLVVLIIPFVQAYSHDSRSNRVRVHACGSVYHQALANSAAERGRPYCSACGIDFENNTIVHHFFVHSFPHGFDNYLPGARIVCKRVIGSINKLDMFLPFLAFLAFRPFSTTRVLVGFRATWLPTIPSKGTIPNTSST